MISEKLLVFTKKRIQPNKLKKIHEKIFCMKRLILFQPLFFYLFIGQNLNAVTQVEIRLCTYEKDENRTCLGEYVKCEIPEEIKEGNFLFKTIEENFNSLKHGKEVLEKYKTPDSFTNKFNYLTSKVYYDNGTNEYIVTPENIKDPDKIKKIEVIFSEHINGIEYNFRYYGSEKIEKIDQLYKDTEIEEGNIEKTFKNEIRILNIFLNERECYINDKILEIICKSIGFKLVGTPKVVFLYNNNAEKIKTIKDYSKDDFLNKEYGFKISQYYELKDENEDKSIHKPILTKDTEPPIPITTKDNTKDNNTDKKDRRNNNSKCC